MDSISTNTKIVIAVVAVLVVVGLGLYFTRSKGAGGAGGDAATATTTQAAIQKALSEQMKLSEGPQGPTGATGPRGFQGEQGLIGPMGPQGAQGIPGPQGLQGPFGLKGDRGEQGPTGPMGPMGLVGPQGLSITGPQGDQGIQGIMGVTGPMGPTGPIGLSVIGPQGPTGPMGPQGIQGEIGPVGPGGARGDQGPQGPTGAPGAPGAPGLRGNDGLSITGPTGAPGATGATGAPGPFGLPCTGGVCNLNGTVIASSVSSQGVISGLFTKSATIAQSLLNFFSKDTPTSSPYNFASIGVTPNNEDLGVFMYDSAGNMKNPLRIQQDKIIAQDATQICIRDQCMTQTDLAGMMGTVAPFNTLRTNFNTINGLFNTPADTAKTTLNRPQLCIGNTCMGETDLKRLIYGTPGSIIQVATTIVNLSGIVSPISYDVWTPISVSGKKSDGSTITQKFEVSITPKFSNSTILIMATVTGTGFGGDIFFAFRRTTSGGNVELPGGSTLTSTGGTRTSTKSAAFGRFQWDGNGNKLETANGQTVDNSPFNGTNTYSVVAGRNSSANTDSRLYLNMTTGVAGGGNIDNKDMYYTTSYITVMEIAGPLPA